MICFELSSMARRFAECAKARKKGTFRIRRRGQVANRTDAAVGVSLPLTDQPFRGNTGMSTAKTERAGIDPQVLATWTPS